MLNPQTLQCSSGIRGNSWRFTAKKGKTPPCCSFCCSFQSDLSRSIVYSNFFFLCFSSAHLTHASSCGVATPRTPTSAKQRKGLRWTGPCVHQERWEWVLPMAACSHVFTCVCVQVGMLPWKSRGAREEPILRTWSPLRCWANSWVQVRRLSCVRRGGRDQDWYVLHGSSVTIKPHPHASRGSICRLPCASLQVFVAEAIMGKFPLAHNVCEVKGVVFVSVMLWWCWLASRVLGAQRAMRSWRWQLSWGCCGCPEGKDGCGSWVPARESQHDGRERLQREKGKFAVVDLLAWGESREDEQLWREDARWQGLRELQPLSHHAGPAPALRYHSVEVTLCS